MKLTQAPMQTDRVAGGPPALTLEGCTGEWVAGTQCQALGVASSCGGVP
jgi:hypothetical protein